MSAGQLFRRLTGIGLAGILAAGIVGGAGTGSAAEARLRAPKVVGGLNFPTAFAFAPNNRVFVVEKNSGVIELINLGGGRHRFFRVRGVSGSGERGMLGIALHPDYPSPAHVFVYVTRRSGGSLKNQIIRLTNVGGKGRDLTRIFQSPASGSPYHNGGRILFGSDDMLYAIVGDGHDAGRAQALGDDRGKVLRMTPGGGIPGDNPLGARRAFAYGIRNSFGMAFDPFSDDLWETENGPACNDELNRIVPGGNYGWGPSQSCAGNAPRNTNRDGPNPILPKRWYNPTIAPTGIAFCDGCSLGRRSRRAAFFGAVNTGQIRRVLLTSNRRGVRGQDVVFRHPRGILSMESRPGGAIFFSDVNGLHRLVRR